MLAPGCRAGQGFSSPHPHRQALNQAQTCGTAHYAQLGNCRALIEACRPGGDSHPLAPLGLAGQAHRRPAQADSRSAGPFRGLRAASPCRLRQLCATRAPCSDFQHPRRCQQRVDPQGRFKVPGFRQSCATRAPCEAFSTPDAARSGLPPLLRPQPSRRVLNQPWVDPWASAAAQGRFHVLIAPVVRDSGTLREHQHPSRCQERIDH